MSFRSTCIQIIKGDEIVPEQFILYHSPINKSLNEHLLKSNVKKDQCGHWHRIKRWAHSRMLPCQDLYDEAGSSLDWIKLEEGLYLKEALLANEQSAVFYDDRR